MDTAQSLIGLLTQLQTIENKFSLILMEAGLKLMSLTDAKIFFLLESDGQSHYYGGKSELCEKVRTGRLFPGATDVEMQVDVNVTALGQKPQPTAPPSNWHPMQALQQTQFSTAPPLNTPSTNGVVNDYQLPGLNTSPRFSPTTTTTTTTTGLGMKRKLTPESIPSSKTIKIEKKEPMEELYEIGDDDNDDDIIIEDDDDDADTVDERSNDSSAVANISMSDESWVQDLTNDDLIRKKLDVILQMKRFDVLNDPTSIERKILFSMFYSLGNRFLTLMNLDDSLHSLLRDKRSRDQLFQKVWSMFPNMHPFHNLKIPKATDVSVQWNLITGCKDFFFKALRREYAKKRPR